MVSECPHCGEHPAAEEGRFYAARSGLRCRDWWRDRTESSESRLILVARDGSRVMYASSREGVRREGAPTGVAAAVQSVDTPARFEYPEGRTGGLVRVTWGDGTAPRVITLHLRNHET